MADNSDNDNQNDKQLVSDNKDMEMTDKDNEDIDQRDDHNDSKDIADDESQDIKSSDLANPIPSPESESDRRCTSASNAGESEYESADDEDIRRVDDTFEESNAEEVKTSTIEPNEEISVQTNNDFEDNESKINAEIESKDIENDSKSETIREQNDSVGSDSNYVDSSDVNDLVKDNNALNELDSEENVLNVNNTEDIDKEVNERTQELIKEVDERLEMNEEFDEEGGHEEIADIDDEYEDMDDSDESVVSDVEENEDLRYESNDKENEDLDVERQQGDGEESIDSQNNLKDKSLDHDEDKRNPQYIPKRGPFYEHDDRMTEEMASTEEPVKEEVVQEVEEVVPKPVVIAKKPIETESIKKKSKKKLWDDNERWGHDLFRAEDQTPKSKDELVNTYGYDIRNEEDAPKARRRKRYTKGPTKYTRQWQDENAYTRGRGSPINQHNDRLDRTERHNRSDTMERKERPDKPDRNERPVRSERFERNDRNERSVRNEVNERSVRNEVNERSVRNDVNERSVRSDGNERSVRSDVTERSVRSDGNERNQKDRSGSDRSVNEYKDRYERKDRVDRRDRMDRKDKHLAHERNDRIDRSYRSEKTSDFNQKKPMVRNDRLLNDNKRNEFEESGERRGHPFSKDDFPELPNNDLRKKLGSNHSSQQEIWKTTPRFGGHNRNENEVQPKNEYKTEPMKIIEAIEHNNRNPGYSDPNSPNVVLTQTFENSKYSQRRGSGNYEFDDERGGPGRQRIRKSLDTNEASGRPIRKANNAVNYPNYPKEPNDNYRNRSNVRVERSYHSEDRNIEPNRNIERYYEEDNYRNPMDRESNYISETSVGLQKMSIEDKSSALNRTNESEQTRPKRYSSLRQQQQRVIPESMPNIGTNTQIQQTSDNRNISSHQFYDSHTIQTTPYFAEPSAPRTQYHPYMSANTPESPQTHPSTYIPQQITQRFITQTASPGTGDTTRYIQTTVPNVVSAPVPVPTPQMSQPLPQAVPQPPPTVMPAAPPGAAYIPSFPSGYPQFPPAPPPTHVPPGYPGHVPPQQPSPHQLAELYRGGVTYYDTQSQQQNAIRQIPQRRPKAAIPIVPPPDQHSGDGDGDKSYVSVNS